ncbi:hypothetical protein SCLCIDRAFT_105624, partial [Scleroderma citrinum Foug A]
PINLFVNSAGELYRPITTIRRDGCVRHIPWTAFLLKPLDWDHVNDVRAIISDANNLQQVFSDENRATLWQVIPALEELQTAWEAKQQDPKYTLYHAALQGGLNKIAKYYNHLDQKPVYILALGTFSFTYSYSC